MANIRDEALESFIQSLPWKQAVPLRKELKPDDYPLHNLPSVIADAVREVQAYVQAPMAMVAACALAVVSAAVQARFDVRRDAVLCGPSALYFMTVGESGERKTKVDDMFMTALNEWQDGQTRKARDDTAVYEANLEAWEQDKKNLEHQIEKLAMFADQIGTAFDPRRLLDSRKPKEPRKAHMLRGDDTTEALLIAMQDYPVAALISAEAGLIFGSHSMSGDKAMGNFSTFNMLWDGKTIRQDRVGREKIHLERPRATVGLMLQSSVLQSFTLKTGNLAKGIGYLARFLFSHPVSTQGTRFYVAPPAGMPALTAFNARVAALLSVPAEFDEFDRLSPNVVELDARARQCWIAFHDEVEESLNDDYQYSDIKEVAAKASENAARLACCYHAFSTDIQSPIPQDTMADACAVVRWYLDEAVRFCQASGLTEEVRDAELVEAFLVAQTKEVIRGKLDGNKVTVQRVRNYGPGSLRGKINAKRIEAAIDVLVDHGRIRVSSSPGSKSKRIVVAPSVMMEYS